MGEPSAFVVDMSLIRFANESGRRGKDQTEIVWDKYAVHCLKMLWNEGHSTAKIGRRMGISKNAVAGKAKRLNTANPDDCQPRPSPIRRNVPPALRAEPERFHPRGPSRKKTLPKVRAAEDVVPEEPADGAGDDNNDVPAVAPTSEKRHTLPDLDASIDLKNLGIDTARTFPRVSSKFCCWPIGEPGTKGFRFCEAQATQGKPYCPQHVAVAYVKARDRREDAA
jgi:GcrA cell cycle regulator